MCSIGAILPKSDYDPALLRQFTLSLLKEMEIRGHDAAGIGIVYDDGMVWIRKAPIPASMFAQLISRIKGWEKNVKVMLLHARAATQGSPYNNENNHPLFELVDDELMYILVHNGHVNTRSSEIQRKREVDSDAILQAIVKECGKGGLSMSCVSKALDHVSGSMAIAVTDTLTKCLVLYRDSNPTYCAYIEELGLVCTSTQSIFENTVKEIEKKQKLTIVKKGYTESMTIYLISKPEDSLRLSLFDAKYGYSQKSYTSYGSYSGYYSWYSYDKIDKDLDI